MRLASLAANPGMVFSCCLACSVLCRAVLLVFHSQKIYIVFVRQYVSSPFSKKCTRDGILDINLTKDVSLLLHAIHSPFYWRILKKTIVFSGLKNPN